jgi:glycosyltransferase involved in cell wall biosynthesis
VSVVHVVVPEGIDDPERPSGGNVYDRRVSQGLAGAGWSVHEHQQAGSWPEPGPQARAVLASELARMPEGAVVLLDGLVASAAPEVLVPQAARLRVVVLLHLPLGATTQDVEVGARECAVLTSAAAVVTTSSWCRSWLLERYQLPADRLHVAEPGVDRADPTRATPGGHRLLCVAAVVPGKGHDVLLAALGDLQDLAWDCVCVGALDRDPVHVARVQRLARDAGIADRVDLAGPRTGADLGATYAAADLLVLPSRFETYGMVVTEALAHGLPVLVSDTGGLPGTVGRLPDGSRPGLLVPPDDAPALAAALRRWLSDGALRDSLRVAARARRPTLPGWGATTDRMSRALAEVDR